MSTQPPNQNKGIYYYGHSIIMWFSQDMKQWTKNVFLLIIILMIGSYFLIEKFDNIIHGPWTQTEIETHAENERKVKAINDSIQLAKDAAQAKKALKSLNEIAIESQRVKYALKNCIGVNYYSIHNGGDIMKADGKWVLEVYSSTERSIATDFPDRQNTDDSKKIWPEWVWLNSKAMEKEQPFIVEDVIRYPGLYKGDAKFYLDQAGIKSCAVMMVRNKGSEILFISLNFSEMDPVANNPRIYRIMQDFRRFVQERID